MSDSKWGRFGNIDVTALNAQVNALDNQFVEVPVGKYEVRLYDLNLGLTKDGYPKLFASFEILCGDYTGRFVFMNHVILRGDDNDKYRVHTAHVFLRSLQSGVEPITFEGLDAYEALIDRIADATLDAEYLLDISYAKGKAGAQNDPAKKPLRVYTILERFAV